MNTVELYEKLFAHYGAQGWWPLIGQGGYHPNRYMHTLTQDEVFEVALGSLLTQNTTFTSVERSLQNLHILGALTPNAIQNLPLETLKDAIRPSGYFNQKANYILQFVEFFIALEGRIPMRSELLACKGIGEETADSILLFGYARDEFKVDAYTKRILTHLGFIGEKAKYGEVKALMEQTLAKHFRQEKKRVEVYQEFHALFVAHAKNYYSKKPYGEGCFLACNRLGKI